MAAKSFTFRLITPQGKLVDSPASYANLPAHDGLIGFAPNHAPAVLKLGLGELRVDFAAEGQGSGGGSRTFLIEEGFAQMLDNRLTVLTTRAIGAETLTESEAAAELAAAEAAKDTAPGGVERLRRTRDRARLKLRMARAARGKAI